MHNKKLVFYIMYQYIYLVFLSVLLTCVAGETTSTPTTAVARCFQFTWLGPRYNNESIFQNATCRDATRLAAGVPCFEPLVVSYDGTWPDVDYIWRNYGESASCILASNDVCATYTYYFNGHAENSTYMCTRAVDGDGQAIINGCYTQTNGSFVTKACFCRSIPGGVPCNSGFINFLSVTAIILATILMMYKQE